MRDPANATDPWGAADPAELLRAVLAGVGRTTTDVLSVLRPIERSDGVVEDFEVVADSGMIARLARTPSVGRRIRELLPSDLATRLVTLGGAAHRSGEISRGDLALVLGENGMVLFPTADDDLHLRVGEVVRIPSAGFVLLLGHDVTEARAARQALLASEQRYRRLVEHSSDPILVLTAGGVITYASPAVRVVLHADPDELLGRPLSVIAHPDDVAACEALLAEVVAVPPGTSRTAQLRTRGTAGTVGWLTVTATNWSDDAAVAGVVLNVRDVTEQHAAQERLEQEALEDPLTGLANRRWFMRALEEAVSRSSRTRAPFAVLVLDVDDFKRVNDSLGHPAGDALLADLARRLVSALRPSDTAARLGGDEFVVIAEDLHTADDARTVAQRILERCSTEYLLPGVAGPVRASVSIGVATSLDPPVAASVPPGAPAAAAPSLPGGGPAVTSEDLRGVELGGRAPGGPAAEVGAGAGAEAGAEAGERAVAPGPGSAPGAGMLHRADAALYRAKRLGRNRIELADGSRSGAPA